MIAHTHTNARKVWCDDQARAITKNLNRKMGDNWQKLFGEDIVEAIWIAEITKVCLSWDESELSNMPGIRVTNSISGIAQALGIVC